MTNLGASLAIFLGAALAGCVMLEQRAAPAEAPLRAGEIRSAQSSAGALEPGKSTKADVRRALGEPTVVDFPSGYEVWVYRERAVKPGEGEKAPPPAQELVLLFPPSGVLSKTRIR